MRDVIDQLEGWWKNGETAALATVVGTFRSAPRQPGASMLVGPAGEAVGSVSGGCVEGAVYELGEQVLRDGRPVLQRYGVVRRRRVRRRPHVRRHPRHLRREGQPRDVRAARGGGRRRAHRVTGRRRHGRAGPRGAAGQAAGGLARQGRRLHRLGPARRRRRATTPAACSTSGRNAMVTYGVDGQRRGEGLSVFVESFAPPPRMIVFGAIDFAAACAKIGSFLGYRVTVCDARPVFATASRFPGANEVVVEWPHRYLAAEAEAGRIDKRTVLCILTHDPKFDVPLLEVALRLPEVAYIGAMGSRRTHDDRLERLRERGITEEEIARMSSPIGLDLGARTPEETAVSIAAEMIAQHWGGAGTRLAEREGPIHMAH